MTIPIPLSTKYLSKWMKMHPTKEGNDYLFPLQYDNARKIIREMAKKALKFGIKPHELRHSSATHYIQCGGFGANNIGGFYYRYGWKFGSPVAITYIKQYMYGGELAQEKVVQHIVSDRMEQLEKQIEGQNIRIQELENAIQKNKNFDSVAVNLFKNKSVQKALIKAMLEQGIGKELVEMMR